MGAGVPCLLFVCRADGTLRAGSPRTPAGHRVLGAVNAEWGILRVPLQGTATVASSVALLVSRGKLCLFEIASPNGQLPVLGFLGYFPEELAADVDQWGGRLSLRGSRCGVFEC